jgi:nitroreductase
MLDPQNPNMQEFGIKLIYDRASTRSYCYEDLSQQTVQSLLEAGVRAPTALHQEPWSFVVVQDRDLLQRISDAAKPLFIKQLSRVGVPREKISHPFLDPHFNIFYDAGALIVVCADPHLPFIEADCWLAAENIMLAATAMGIGSCAIGSALPALNLPEVKSELNIPDSFTAVAALIVGVPKTKAQPSLRHPPRVLSWRLPAV